MQTGLTEHKPRRSLLQRSVRIALKLMLTVVIILLIVILLVQTPYVQNIIRSKAEKYLSRKLNTRVEIGGLYVGFPRTVLLKNIYIEDKQKDTLLSAGLIHVDLSIWELLHSQVDIRELQLGDLTAKIKRNLPDTIFNFQFLADAFAGKPKTASSPTDTSSMKMSLHELLLDNIRLVYKDTVTGNDDEVSIAHSVTQFDQFDPSAAQFNITSFTLKGLRARIVQGQPLVASAPTPTSAPTPPPSRKSSSGSFWLRLGHIDLQNGDFDYRNTAGALFANLQLGHLAANVKTFDLSERIIDLKDIQLDSTQTAIRTGAIRTGAIAPHTTQTDSSGNWRITVAAIRLNGNHVQFDNDARRHQAMGVDYAHLDLAGLTLHAAGLTYTGDSVSGKITRAQFQEKSGFQLDGLQTDFLYTDKQAYLRDLDLKTPGTTLQRNLSIHYSSPGGIANDPEHTQIDLDLRNSRVQVKDILSFVPSLRKQPAFSNPAGSWQINARVAGSLSALHIQTLQFSGLQDIRIDLSGTIQHPTDMRRLFADLDIRNLSGSRQGLVSLLPTNTLPQAINIPTHFDLHGKLKGGMDDLQTDIVLNSSSGTLTVKGLIRNFKDPKNAAYDAVVRTKALDLGFILRDDRQWGLVTAGFTVKGTGFDPQTANAKLNGTIASAIIRQYDYRDFQFDASVADKHFELQSSIRNTAVHFKLKASGDLANKFPALKLDWQIDTLDLHALHLVSDTLQFKGHITADFASTDPDSLLGNLKIGGISLVSGTHQLATDSIVLLAQRISGIEDIRFRSEMADLDLIGHYKINEIAPALRATIDKYYRTVASNSHGAGTDSAMVGSGPAPGHFASQDWTMRLNLRVSPIVLALMPSLKGTDSIGAQIAFNSDRRDLQLALNAPRIQLGKQSFQKIAIRASTGDKELQYGVQLASATGSGFELHQSSVQGHLADDHLFTTVVLKDTKGKDRYRIAGQLDKSGSGEKFILNPDSLLLNYDQWVVSRDNYIQYSPSGIVIKDFKITNKTETLQIASREQSPSSPIEVSFTDFKLSTLSRFAEQDSALVEGLLNGTAEVKNTLTNPVFTSDLKVKNLTYKRDTVGDLVVKVNNETANAYTADISLEGNRNDVRVKGNYYAGESRIDMKLDLNQLNLAAIRPFVSEQVQDLKGTLKGSLALSGSFDKPGINGNLHFDSTLVTPMISGEPLKLSKEDIEFDADGFNFSEFSLQDSAGNKATIDGNVFTKDYKDYDVDITINANNFRLVNAAEASNRLFYGKLNLDAAMNVTGDPLDALKVDGDIRVNKKTDFVLVLPQSSPEVVNRLGVVRFVDKAHPDDTLVDRRALTLAASNAEIKGFDVSLNIETDSNALLTMIIDERNGDALSARGRSNLVFGMDKSGKTDLTGAFEVESGTYALSLSALKRKFQIQHGSTITWTGDPTSAILDVSATYTANTPSIDLIANEISGRPQDEINKFKQKLPFQVTLKMEGDLLKPAITFDISLPTDVLTLWPDVDQKLQQIRVEQSEMNKQVFALLLLNRFVGEDPLNPAGGGASIGNIAFQSASQILTNQLDQLAASLIKGVDIHFDLNNEQDFSTGTEQDYTELNVSVSKQLFSERVSVNVGSNFDVQGTGSPNRNGSNLAGDVAVDYKLTQDGRYMIRAYRKNQYEAVVEGEVVETGVSFVLTFDYDKFREIFGKTQVEKLAARKLVRPPNSPDGKAPENTNPPAGNGTPTQGNGKSPGNGNTPVNNGGPSR
jgi:translocation and assembly module TamB